MSRLVVRHPFHAVIRFVLVSCFTFSLVLGGTICATPPELGQFSAFPGSAANSALNPPSGVSRHGEAPIRRRYNQF